MADAAYPLRLGAIDIGSNAIRLLVAEFHEPHAFVPLVQRRLAIRLGHDAFLTGELPGQAIAAALRGLRSFRKKLDKRRVVQYRAVATSAVRDSRNGSELVARARTEAGVDIDVISGEEEARLVHVAVRQRIRLGDRHWLLADLGGGSLEISRVDHHQIYMSESRKLGAVRMLEELHAAEQDIAEFRRRLDAQMESLRDSPVLRADGAGFIATGGNIEELARLARAAPAVQGVPALHMSDLQALIDRISDLGYQERVTRMGLRPDRADVILPAALIYQRLAQLAGAEFILVPAVGVKDGVIWQLFDLIRS